MIMGLSSETVCILEDMGGGAERKLGAVGIAGLSSTAAGSKHSDVSRPWHHASEVLCLLGRKVQHPNMNASDV